MLSTKIMRYYCNFDKCVTQYDVSKRFKELTAMLRYYLYKKTGQSAAAFFMVRIKKQAYSIG